VPPQAKARLGCRRRGCGGRRAGPADSFVDLLADLLGLLANPIAAHRLESPSEQSLSDDSLATRPDARFNRRVEWMRKSALRLLKHRAALRGGNNHFCRNGLT
jgi:hypothetical protein